MREEERKVVEVWVRRGSLIAPPKRGDFVCARVCSAFVSWVCVPVSFPGRFCGCQPPKPQPRGGCAAAFVGLFFTRRLACVGGAPAQAAAGGCLSLSIRYESVKAVTEETKRASCPS